jgi:hypothetical protein
MRVFVRSWQRRLVLAVAVIALIPFAYAFYSSGEVEPLLAAACVSWDRDATADISRLLADSTSAGEARLAQALHRLRRARRSCRAGAVEPAREDYEHLHTEYLVSETARDSPSHCAGLATEFAMAGKSMVRQELACGDR